MNIRLDSKCIRVRVSFDEAKTLCRVGKIQEAISFPTGYFFLELNETEEENLSCASSGERRINLCVPKLALKRLMLSIESESLTSKKSLEIYEMTVVDSKSVELRFEIDCFTEKKKMKGKNHE